MLRLPILRVIPIVVLASLLVMINPTTMLPSVGKTGYAAPLPPTGVGVNQEQLVGTPTPIEDATDDEDQIKRAIETELALLDATPAKVTWEITQIHRSESWAYAFLVPATDQSRAHLGVLPYVAIARESTEGVWGAVLPGTREKYVDWLAQMPDVLMSKDTRAYLVPPLPASALKLSNVSGYRLPWPNDTQAWAAKHDYPAIDFDIWGGNNRGTIRAAKSGTVRFRKDTSTTECGYPPIQGCPWQAANMIVIEHSSTEYSWYMHLSPGTIPSGIQEGQWVERGTDLGQEGKTGWASGDHLHFHVATSFGCCSGSGSTRAPTWPSTTVAVDFEEYGWNSLPQWPQSRNTAPQTSCNPSADQIALYIDGSYSGQCVVKGIGDYSTPSAIGLPNDAISSIRVGGNVQAVLCRDDNYSGTCETFTGDDGNLGDNSIGDNQVSSLRVQTRGGGTVNGVELCDNTNYGGECRVYTEGRYGDLGSFNDRAESMRFRGSYASTYPLGRYEAVIFDQTNFGGTPGAYTRDLPDLGTECLGCYRNHVRSLEIRWQCQPPGGPPSLSGPTNGSTFNTSDPITLSWGGTDYGGGFEAQLATDSNFNSVVAYRDWNGSTVWGIGLRPTGTYYWRVRSRETSHNCGTNWSAQWSFTVQAAAPNAPSTLSAQAVSCSQMNLSWTDNSNDEDGFRIYRNGSAVGTVGAGSQSYQDTGLSGSTSYSYQVKAYRGGLESDGSNTVSVTTPECPPTTFNYWKGEYFNNRDLSGSPTLMRDDFSLYFDWGMSAPHPAINTDNFSARWTRTLNFDAGAYRFHLLHDDGARLFIDDVLQVNHWADCCDWDVSPNINLTGGSHTLRYEMFEGVGAAHAGLYWERMDISGWRGEYYNNETMADHPILVRNDPDLNFTWNANPPDPLVQADHFSVRWTRSVNFSAGDYQFDIYHDDGVRLYIDNVLIFENWCGNCALTEGVNRTLTEGTHTLKIEYREVAGFAAIRLSWQALVAPPPNDDFNSAAVVSGLPFSASQNTRGATTASDDPNTCGSSSVPQNSRSVWFRFTPAASSTLTIDTLGSNYDTVLAVWTGTRGNLASVACNDDFEGLRSRVSFEGQAGTTYFIEVMAYSSGAGGDLTLNVRGPASSRRQDDLDGDGKSDLVWINRLAGQSIGWLMDGATIRSWNFLPAVSGTSWQLVAEGDLDGNGKLDLVWRDASSGQNIVWFMNGLTVTAYAWLPNLTDPAWYVVAAGDLDGNGKADLVWRNFTNGQNVAWFLDGGTLTSYAWLPAVADPGWRVVLTGDLDGNGKADLVWRNATNGQNVAWLMDGATLTSFAWLPSVDGAAWTPAGIGDLDGNGKADLVWRNTTTGQNVAWLMNGTAVVGYPPLDAITDQAWSIAAVDDLDGNGKADLVWRNTTTGQNVAWFMDGATLTSYAFLSTVNDRNWLIVSPTYLSSWAGPRGGAAKTSDQGQGGGRTPAEPTRETVDKGAPFWTAPEGAKSAPIWTAPTEAEKWPMWTAPQATEPFWTPATPSELTGPAPRKEP